MKGSYVTSHVLDITLGKPAVGILVELYAQLEKVWSVIATDYTDTMGRSNLGSERLVDGIYRLHFITKTYFSNLDKETLFPEIVLTFVVDQKQEHYHIPVLISPFSYSVYRGS